MIEPPPLPLPIEEPTVSHMFEVYYKPPPDSGREAILTQWVASQGRRLTFREDPAEPVSTAVCLTYEFEDLERAEAAATALRQQGEHVEGPVDYGE